MWYVQYNKNYSVVQQLSEHWEEFVCELLRLISINEDIQQPSHVDLLFFFFSISTAFFFSN